MFIQHKRRVVDLIAKFEWGSKAASVPSPHIPTSIVLYEDTQEAERTYW